MTARSQVARLLALVPFVQERSQVPLAELAARFDVSSTQIEQDLKVLWFCGLPGLQMGDLIDVDFDALEGEGVVRVSNADYLARPLRLGATEATTLIVALRTLRDTSDEAVREVIDRALAKLETAAVDGAELAARVDVQVPREVLDTAVLRERLDGAVRGGRRVRLSYWVPTRDETTDREVEPVAVLQAEGRAYLDAWCHLAGDRRLFRLDRIVDATVLEATVSEQRVARDLSRGLFAPGAGDLTATLLLRPGARWVAEYYPVDSVHPVPDPDDPQGPADAALEVTLSMGDPAWLVRLMLRLGAHARVLDPPEVADLVRDAARAALDRYSA